jgi:hypothetical protein
LSRSASLVRLGQAEPRNRDDPFHARAADPLQVDFDGADRMMPSQLAAAFFFRI